MKPIDVSGVALLVLAEARSKLLSSDRLVGNPTQKPCSTRYD